MARTDGASACLAHLRALTQHICVRARSIAADVGGVEGPIDHHTVLGYLAALTRVFVLEDLPAWAPALRSRSLLRSAPTRHFVDPSLAVAALGADPDRLLRDVRTLGFLFESLVVRDLLVYAGALDATVSHYRDSTDLEADAIIEWRDGIWAAFEVKLGPGAVDEAARTLLRVADRVDSSRHGPPAALVVITGWGYGYRRPDGVSVIPIGALAP
jgi:predicted AAA+ superfamily ATPase